MPWRLQLNCIHPEHFAWFFGIHSIAKHAALFALWPCLTCILLVRDTADAETAARNTRSSSSFCGCPQCRNTGGIFSFSFILLKRTWRRIYKAKGKLRPPCGPRYRDAVRKEAEYFSGTGRPSNQRLLRSGISVSPETRGQFAEWTAFLRYGVSIAKPTRRADKIGTIPQQTTVTS
jgi:hypothetical protein